MHKGIYEKLPEAEYRAAVGLNKSNMPDLLRSPAHYQAALIYQHDPTPATILGSAFHLRVLEPDRFNREIFEHGNKTPKQTTEGIFLHKSDFEKIEAMYQAIQTHSIAKNLFIGGEPEVSIFWEDPEFHFTGKGRIDYVRKDLNILVDLKTCKDASVAGFNEDAFYYKYHWQKLWYSQGWANVSDGAQYDFIFVCIEKEPPYGIGIFDRLSSFLKNDATENITKVKKMYNNCIQTSIWPCYKETINDLIGPRWVKDKGEGIYD
jgi:hypothetical protein